MNILQRQNFTQKCGGQIETINLNQPWISGDTNKKKTEKYCDNMTPSQSDLFLYTDTFASKTLSVNK